MNEWLDILINPAFWVAVLRIATPLILGTLGVLWCERAGVLNLAIEGIMVAGALAGWLGVYLGLPLWGGVAVAAFTGAGFGLLHGLASGDGAEGVDVALLGAAVDLVPQLFGTALGQRVFDVHAATQTHHVGGGVAALHTFPAGVGGPVFLQGFDLLLAAQLFVEGLRHVELSVKLKG